MVWENLIVSYTKGLVQKKIFLEKAKSQGATYIRGASHIRDPTVRQVSTVDDDDCAK